MRWQTETLRGTRSCTMLEMVSGNGVGTLSGESKNSNGRSKRSPGSARVKRSSDVKNME